MPSAAVSSLMLFASWTDVTVDLGKSSSHHALSCSGLATDSFGVPGAGNTVMRIVSVTHGFFESPIMLMRETILLNRGWTKT